MVISEIHFLLVPVVNRRKISFGGHRPRSIKSKFNIILHLLKWDSVSVMY